jgi:hypothetical protein
MGGALRIAAISGGAPGKTDPFLCDLARRLTADGVCLSGAVQRTLPATPLRNKTMELVLLPDGETVTISEDRPAGAEGCSLDPGAFETAASRIAAAIGPGADAVVLSKYGQRETEGRGLRAAIVAAVEHDLPLAIGVTPARLADFKAFVGTEVTVLGPDLDIVRAWFGTPPPSRT